jgi:hypothetical protein
MAARQEVPFGVQGGRRAEVVFHRLVVVAVLVLVVSVVEFVLTYASITSIGLTLIAFVLALVLLALVIDLGVILFSTGEPEQRRIREEM